MRVVLCQNNKGCITHSFQRAGSPVYYMNIAKVPFPGILVSPRALNILSGFTRFAAL